MSTLPDIARIDTLKTRLTTGLGRLARASVLGLALALAGGVGLPSALALSADQAAAGDVQYAGDGSAIVRLPGGGDERLDPVTANRIRAAMRRESDDAAEAALAQIMRGAPSDQIPAIAVVAANMAPSRASLISSAAISADPREGLAAARALPFVRGVRNDQVLLGVHSSGNRQAYRSLRSDFDAQSGGGLPPPRDIDRASDEDRRRPSGGGLLGGGLRIRIK